MIKHFIFFFTLSLLLLTPTYPQTIHISTIIPLPYPHYILVPTLPHYEKYTITAYTAGTESTGKNPGDKNYGITASGATVRANHTISCPTHLRFGTQIFIKELQHTYTCTDRGSGIIGKHIDIYMENLKTAQNFGRRTLNILILPKE
jgi:3D (Asp-Asp-Asp) domain-containing protein